MILTHLTHHVLSRRRTYSAGSWLLCIARTSRVLLFPRAHRELCQLPLYRAYVARPDNDDLFHHLSHRHYLAKHFGTRQRVRLVLDHYRYENRRFSDGYKRQVYLGPGLRLWQREEAGVLADMLLTMGSRNTAEGDLTLCLRMDGQRLHRISFSWIDGALVDRPGCMLPYIGRNQGHGPEEEAAFERFNHAFPNNSPSYFCLAAMQGIALAIDAPHMLGVSTDAQVASRRDAGKYFANAYDGFWTIVGGLPVDRGRAFAIPVPFHVKPVNELASKHRKRALQRRAHWQAISDAARAVVHAHLATHPVPTPLAEAAQV